MSASDMLTMPTRWIGVDGCRAGWVAAGIRADGEVKVDVYPSIGALCEQLGSDDRLLIDIPIGFAADEDGTRACDRQARKLLGGRRASSVFPCPTREALRADTYADACDVNEEHTGKRLSRQAWAIAPKIREVDTFLRINDHARGRMREVHPEVLFWALKGSRPMQHRKGGWAGCEERLFVLRRFVPNLRDVLREAVDRHVQTRVGPDDILDAIVAAVTGHFGGDALQTIPEDPPVDAFGLATEMVYWMPG